MKKGKLRHFFMGILLVALLAVSTAFVCTACGSSDGGEPLTIVSVEKTSSEGLTDTYTMTFSDNSTFTFTVKNGETGGQGMPGTPGSNGSSAYELWKKYHPDYAGTEEVWLQDLIHGRLTEDYMEHATCLITLKVTDGTNPLKDVLVDAGGFGYLTNAAGEARILTGEGELTLTLSKAGYKSASRTLTAEEISAAGNALTVNLSLEAHQTVEGYTLHSENPAFMTIRSEQNLAYFYWYFAYEETGLRIAVDVVDDEIVAVNSNAGYNDNIEFVIQKNALSNNWSIGNSFNVMVPLASQGEWARFAASGSEWGANEYAARVANGTIAVKKLPRYRATDGWDGASIEIFLDYSIWGMAPSNAAGNLTVLIGGRNGDFSGNTYFRSMVEYDMIWGNAQTGARILADGTLADNFFDLPDLEEATRVSRAYREGKTLADDMGVVTCEGGLVREYKANVQLFTDRPYIVNKDGMPSALEGMSFMRAPLDGEHTYTVTEEGYVIVTLPHTSNFGTLAGNLERDGFVRITGELPTIGYYADRLGFMSETMSYYVKWCAAEEEFTIGSWSVVFFRGQESYEEDTWMKTAATVEKLDTPEKIAAVAPSTRLWQGIPGIQAIEKADGTTRLFASFFSGMDREPRIGNYALIYYSDNDGEDWQPAFRIYFPGEIDDSRVFDPSLFADEEGDLWIWWSQTNYNFADSGILRCEIENADGTLDEMTAGEISFVAHGLKLNKPKILSNGEWMFAAHDFIDRGNTKVYVSADKGATWTLRGQMDVPASYFANEPALAEGKDQSGRPCLICWNRTNLSYNCAISYSYDWGATWTKGTESSILEPSSRPNAITLPSGNVLYLHHYWTTARERMTAFLSTDGGVTFPHALVLDERAEVTYPDVTLDKDGNIYVVWDFNRYDEKQILMAKITEAELLAIDGMKIMDTSRIQVISSLSLSDMSADVEVTLQGAPEEGIAVTAVSPFNTYTATEEGGKYVFADLPAALYEIRVTADGNLLATREMTLGEWIDSEFITVKLEISVEAVTVTGKVVNGLTDEPIVGATVTAGEQSVTTAEGGAFTLTDVPEGVTATVSYEGFVSQTLPLTEGGTIYLVPEGTGYIGCTNGIIDENTNIGQQIWRVERAYLTRTDSGITFTAFVVNDPGVADTAKFGQDNVTTLTVAFNVDTFGTDRSNHTFLVDLFGDNTTRANNYPNNKSTQLWNITATHEGITNNVTSLGNERFKMEATFTYALLSQHMNSTVTKEKPIGATITIGRKTSTSGSWQYGSCLYGGTFHSRFHPAEYLMYSADGSVIPYGDYSVQAFRELEEALKGTDAYREGKTLVKDMGAFSAPANTSLATFTTGVALWSDRVGTHTYNGTAPELDGMTYLYKKVKDEPAVTVTKEGYLLLLAQSAYPVSDPGWIKIRDMANYGVGGSGTATFEIYGRWAKQGSVITSPQFTVLLTNADAEALETDILVFGDSYTDTKYWKSFNSTMTPYGAKTIGISGSRVATATGNDPYGWVKRAEMGEIAKYNPKKILINIGINDMRNGATEQETAAGIIELLTILHEQLPDTEIYWLYIPTTQEKFKLWYHYAKCDQLVQAFVDGDESGKLHTIDYGDDLYTTFHGIRSLDNSMFADGLHLSDKGYAILEKHIYEALNLTPKA